MNTATLGKLKGLPLRPTQIEAIDFIRGSGRRFIAVRGPTGVGKTCLGFESMNPPFYYVCSSKQLQEQAVKDYPEAVVLMGRSNYPCEKYGHADLCLERKRCDDCMYEAAKAAAMFADMTILNFHYFLNVFNFTEGLGERNIIIDEADDLENVMVSFISIEFVSGHLEWLGIDPTMPDLKTKIESVRRWISAKKMVTGQLLNIMEEEMNKIQWSCKHRQPTPYEVLKIKKYRALKTFDWKLAMLIGENLEDDWIYRYDDKHGRLTLKPIWLGRKLMDKFLYSKVDRVLFMSATIPSKEIFCGLYGIEPEEIDYEDLPNVWESDRRKIIYKPVYNITHKNKSDELDWKVVEAVKEIIETNPGKGLIHTVNFSLAKLIEHISDRIIVHGGKDRKEKFNRFMETDGAIWVSPSSTRGIDLPDDKCEWIIWLKAPYLNLQDPQVNARIHGSGKFGKLWYASNAVQAIIQGCGRGFRHENDYCTVWMLDEQIGRLLKDNAGLFPLWFRELIVYE
jgi:Rad3-related DNA helicase